MGLFSGPMFGNGGLFGSSGARRDRRSAGRCAHGDDGPTTAGWRLLPTALSFGQIMGQALMAGQAARQQSIKMQQARDAADMEKQYKASADKSPE
jgi:hypothetical protein